MEAAHLHVSQVHLSLLSFLSSRAPGEHCAGALSSLTDPHPPAVVGAVGARLRPPAAAVDTCQRANSVPPQVPVSCLWEVSALSFSVIKKEHA